MGRASRQLVQEPPNCCFVIIHKEFCGVRQWPLCSRRIRGNEGKVKDEGQENEGAQSKGKNISSTEGKEKKQTHLRVSVQMCHA